MSTTRAPMRASATRDFLTGGLYCNRYALHGEVFMPRESRNVYDHAFRSWGARIIHGDTEEASAHNRKVY
jgi:threonine dehydratase